MKILYKDRHEPIKHSATSSDGGFLETTVTGVTNLASGSLVYGDASEIVTELSSGTLGDVLTMGAVNPHWQAGATVTQAVEKIASTYLAGGGSSITCSFTPVDQVDCAKFYGVLNATKPTSSNIFHMYINGITTSTYQYQWQEVEGAGTRTNGYTSATNQLQVVHNWASLSNTVTFDIVCNASSDLLQYSTLGMGNSDYKTCVGSNTTASQTSLSEVRFDCDNPSGSMGAGTTLSVYKVNL